MALVAEFTTPIEAFAAGRALAGSPASTVELERIVPTDSSLVPFLWVWGDGLAEYETRLAAESGVDDVRRVVTQDDRALYRVDRDSQRPSTTRKLFDLEFTLLSGVCTGGGWTFEIRFPSSDAAAAFRSRITEIDVPHDLTKLSTEVESDGARSFGLTAEQRETLAAAVRHGYFEEPRDATLSELADELDISLSAASGRLRRASATLVQNTVLSQSMPSRPSSHD